VICRVDGSVHRGRTVTLAADLDPEAVARAIREGTARSDGLAVSVTARRPHPAHERVGCLHPDIGLRVRTALAAAARARGLSTPHDPELRRARERLAELDVDGVDAEQARRAVAATGADTDRLRERMATVRGRFQARRDNDLATEPARERLRETARDLSEAETSAAAARQRLDRERRRAREAHDILERRLRLEDEVANLERRARAALVERVRDAYESALLSVPGGPGRPPEDPFAVEEFTAALAAARVAAFEAPAVVAGDRFGSARAASRWLGAPVVYL